MLRCATWSSRTKCWRPSGNSCRSRPPPAPTLMSCLRPTLPTCASSWTTWAMKNSSWSPTCIRWQTWWRTTKSSEFKVTETGMHFPASLLLHYSTLLANTWAPKCRYLQKHADITFIFVIQYLSKPRSCTVISWMKHIAYGAIIKYHSLCSIMFAICGWMQRLLKSTTVHFKCNCQWQNEPFVSAAPKWPYKMNTCVCCPRVAKNPLYKGKRFILSYSLKFCLLFCLLVILVD